MNIKYNLYKKIYHKSYFDNFRDLSYKAAKIILSDLYKDFKFKSVVDFGCGTGGWLRAAWEQNNAIKLTGIDGDYIKNILDFDLFGRGYRPINNKIEGLKDYRYSIVIENSKSDYYFT